MVKRIIPALCALLVLCGTGCSDGNDSSSSSSQAEESPESAAVSSAADSSKAETVPARTVGEKLKAVYDIISSGSYTFEIELTGTNVPETIEITRIVSGEDSYQLQQEKLGNHGTVSFSGKSFDFDYVCGMYRENAEPPQPGMIEQIVKGNVPRTDAAAVSPENGCDCEQYTYTGDTFITVIDFFFDKSDGHLVKYTTAYSVEGRDDIIETRTVKKLEKGADTSVFNAYFADTLVNFDTMSEPQRQGFCQGLCATWGVTADEMFRLGVSSDSFGKIDYDTLFTLIHTYGKHRTPAGDSSVSGDESSGSPDESSESTEDSSESSDSTESAAESSEESSEE
ncbi:hypothetical protein SAMN02910317_01651 [Ruminococcaceae bacterium FB2012]|nr:hypothetical protein SAMN02910317_01651 [Ruminococcaceae bacterium FB2012]